MLTSYRPVIYLVEVWFYIERLQTCTYKLLNAVQETCEVCDSWMCSEVDGVVKSFLLEESGVKSKK